MKFPPARYEENPCTETIMREVEADPMANAVWSVIQRIARLGRPSPRQNERSKKQSERPHAKARPATETCSAQS